MTLRARYAFTAYRPDAEGVQRPVAFSTGQIVDDATPEESASWLANGHVETVAPAPSWEAPAT